jgi:hypothetical protein
MGSLAVSALTVVFQELHEDLMNLEILQLALLCQETRDMTWSMLKKRKQKREAFLAKRRKLETVWK